MSDNLIFPDGSDDGPFDDGSFGDGSSDAPSFDDASFDAVSFDDGSFAVSPEAGGSFGAPLADGDAPDPFESGGDDPFDLSFSDAEPGFPDAQGDGAETPLPPADPAAETPKKEKKDKLPKSKDGLVLGIHVTPKHVCGVLVRPSGGGYEPLRQFVRNRSESQFGGPSGPALSPDAIGEEEPALEMAGGDVQVQFGGVGEIDFSAEFAGLGVATDAAFDSAATVGHVDVQAQPIVFELRDILTECEKAGFGRPALAFAVDSPDVEYFELTVTPEKKASKKAPKKSSKKASKGDKKAKQEAPAEGPVKRERLLGLLPDLDPGVDKSRAAFVPMTPRDGFQRYMAVVPTASEPVVESLKMLREQSSHRKTVFRTLEAEVPLLVGLVRLTSAPEPGENTAVVRVGAEDTVVLLLTGDEIHHYEQMQSVTGFDGPDTICSRVLLQQDVQGVGTVHNVVVVAEEREKELVQGFAAFYPEARVETLREGLAGLGLVGPYGPLAPTLVEAAGAAVAGHLRSAKGGRSGPFEDVNLLPAALRKRRRTFEFSLSWHTLVAGVLLFLSALFFSYSYVAQKGEIAQAEQQLAEYPPEAKMSVPQLQARIDSLQTRQADLTASLTALDTLLVGTDRWTQTMLRSTRAAAQTGGIWIEEWTPDGTAVSLRGFSTTRDRVVGLGQRLNATIEEVTFQAVRDYPVYEYRMRFDQPQELPQITRVLREQAAGPAPADDPLGALDAPPPTPSPAVN